MFFCFCPPQHRFDVAALNFRGCSGELSRYPVGYHLGFTDDLLHVVREQGVLEMAVPKCCGIRCLFTRGARLVVPRNAEGVD